MHDLSTIEKNIVEALGTDTLRLEQLVPKTGYEVGAFPTGSRVTFLEGNSQ